MKKKFLQITLLGLIGIVAITIFSSNKTKESNYRDGGSGNLVDELYDKAVDKSDALAAIEANIKKYHDKKVAAIKDFQKFDYYNTRFYTDANGKLSNIKDTTIREKAKKIITISETNYIAKVALFNNQIAAIEKKEALLNNLHELLKISITTPIIEKYQSTDLPNSNDLQGVDNDLKNIIDVINKQIK